MKLICIFFILSIALHGIYAMNKKPTDAPSLEKIIHKLSPEEVAALEQHIINIFKNPDAQAEPFNQLHLFAYQRQHQLLLIRNKMKQVEMLLHPPHLLPYHPTFLAPTLKTISYWSKKKFNR